MYLRLIFILQIIYRGFSVENEFQEKILSQLTTLDSDVSQHHICGSLPDPTILILTQNFNYSDYGSVYKSKDKGLRWTKMAHTFFALGHHELEHEDEEIGYVIDIKISPADPDTVIFLGSHGINWRSTNCGQDVEAMNQGQPISDIEFHPTEKTWVLASSWNECDSFEEQDCLVNRELFFSNDLGDNWEMLSDFIYEYGWAQQDIKQLKENQQIHLQVPKQRIIFVYLPNKKKDHQDIDIFDKDINIYYSDDFFKTKKRALSGGNSFSLNNEYIYGAKFTQSSNGEEIVSLSVTYRNLQKYNFQNVNVPLKKFKDREYHIIDSSSGQIFILINHFGPTSKFGNIYISDSTGSRLTLSIQNTAIDEDANIEFTKVNSLDGVYVTNVYNNYYIKKYGTQDLFDNSINKKNNIDNYQKSKITYDNGGIWHDIPAPSVDSLGNKYQCTDDQCFLHFHINIQSHRFGPLYSPQRALGHILATGNVGKHLNQNEVNTFYSNDGGHSFVELLKGSHIYEISDHGNIIILADDQQMTNFVYFSLDDGKTLNKYYFSESKFYIFDIREVSNNKFFVYGTDDSERGMIFGIDMEKVFPRICQGEPDTEGSDYTKWVFPKEGCVQGVKTTYKKKISPSQCLNGDYYEKVYERHFCTCTEEDWECAMGYMRNESGTCIIMKQQEFKMPEVCEDTYSISSGYTKIAADRCQGGVQYYDIVIPCQNNRNFRTIVMCLTVFLIGLILFTLKNTVRYKSVDETHLNYEDQEDNEEFNPRN